jgi:hypothetical protein
VGAINFTVYLRKTPSHFLFYYSQPTSPSAPSNWIRIYILTSRHCDEDHGFRLYYGNCLDLLDQIPSNILTGFLNGVCRPALLFVPRRFNLQGRRSRLREQRAIDESGGLGTDFRFNVVRAAAPTPARTEPQRHGLGQVSRRIRGGRHRHNDTVMKSDVFAFAFGQGIRPGG